VVGDGGRIVGSRSFSATAVTIDQSVREGAMHLCCE
jgi:hypothetical protein